MRVSPSCAACLWERQKQKTPNPDYLARVREIIDTRKEDDTAPYLVYLFAEAHEKFFGKPPSFRDVKKRYNDCVLRLEPAIRSRIAASPDPLAAALAFARAGNYIDFGALEKVEQDTLLTLLDTASLNERDLPAYREFLRACREAESFLLIADNCGEIVLDKLFLEELRKSFPRLSCAVMVRGSEVLNDATSEDAEQAGMGKVAEIISSGAAAAGAIYQLMSSEARNALDTADVILAKGQGNYESLCNQGRHIFYSLLCKCELFTARFQAPLFTGIFAEERPVSLAASPLHEPAPDAGP